jgi:hypothetical protein
VVADLMDGVLEDLPCMFSTLRVELRPAHLRRHRRSGLTTWGGFGRRRRQTTDPIRGSPDSSPTRLGESSAMVFLAAASIRSGLQMVLLASALLTTRQWNRVRGTKGEGGEAQKNPQWDGAAGELDANGIHPQVLLRRHAIISTPLSSVVVRGPCSRPWGRRGRRGQ